MSEFAIADVLPGRLNAMVKNVMLQMEITDPNEAVRRINSGEWTVSQVVRSWREEDGVIYFSITSDGTTGPEWIERLEKKGKRLDYAKSILRSEDFKPTSGVTTQVAVLKGKIFSDNNRITRKIQAEAKERKFEKLNAEAACLIREMFTDKELEAMGLSWIVVMHEPIKGSDGGPRFLGTYRDDSGQWLNAYNSDPERGWHDDRGFAFSVSQS